MSMAQNAAKDMEASAHRDEATDEAIVARAMALAMLWAALHWIMHQYGQWKLWPKSARMQ